MHNSIQNRQDILPFNRPDVPELVTIKKAASAIGVEYRQLLEAVNTGAVPHYRIGRSRQLVNVSEVISIMKKDGGNQ